MHCGFCRSCKVTSDLVAAQSEVMTVIGSYCRDQRGHRAFGLRVCIVSIPQSRSRPAANQATATWESVCCEIPSDFEISRVCCRALEGRPQHRMHLKDLHIVRRSLSHRGEPENHSGSRRTANAVQIGLDWFQFKQGSLYISRSPTCISMTASRMKCLRGRLLLELPRDLLFNLAQLKMVSA